MNEELVAALKEVLADEYALYFKAKGYHWNVEGVHFVSFHDLFEEIADDVYGATDPTAEYIRALGVYAPFKMSRFQEMTSIPETEVSTDCHSMAQDLLMATQQIIVCINKAFKAATAADEQGIADFLAGRDSAHKKWSWQLRSSLKD